MRILRLLFLFMATVGTASASIGVWTDNGTVITTISSTTGLHAPSVIYESGCIIVASPCFKIWVAGNSPTPGLFYGESLDGITWSGYSGNPVKSTGTNLAAEVFKVSSTYYMFLVANTASPTQLDEYTSPDGITWTLKTSGAIAAGSVGAWDNPQVWPSGLVDIINGTWYLSYTGGPKGSDPNKSFPMGIATSPDGITWTKYASNPVIDDNHISANMNFHKVGARYYAWTNYCPYGVPRGNNGYPNDTGRYSATSPTGPWLDLGTPAVYRTLTSEGVGLSTGEVAQPHLVEANGNVYMFTTDIVDGTNPNGGTIGMLEAAGTSITNIVATHEGIVNVPIPGTGGFELNGLTANTAYDTFIRADANPLSGNWTAIGTTGSYVVSQLSSNGVLSTVNNKFGDSYYTAVSFPNDQWSQSRVNVLAGASFIGASVRMTGGGSDDSEYGLSWNGATGAAATTLWVDYVNAAGTHTHIYIFSGTSPTLSVGDLLTISAVGTTISIYLNRILLGTVTHTTLTGGHAGFFIGPITLNTNAKIDLWQGGAVSAAPAYSIPTAGKVVFQ